MATHRVKLPMARVLVVDDDDAMRELLVEALDDEGYDVIAVRDGASALHVLFEDPAGADVVVTDHRMPAMTGLEVAEQVRKRAGWTPVVIVSAFADAAMEDRARGLGVCSVFPKPFSVAALLGVVRRLVPIGV